MDNVLFSSESSGDDDEQVAMYRNYQERTNFLILNRQSFLEAFRLSRMQVEYLLTELGLGERLATATNRSMALTAEQRLLLCLSWLGNGGQQHATGRMHGVSKSTVCRIVKEVVECLFDIAPQTICWPQQVDNIANEFYARGGFPNVCGIVDGTMINIDSPADVRDEHGVVVRRRFEETYVNRHGNHALNVMAICGPNLSFYALNASWPGSVHDLRVLKNSAVYNAFQGGWRPFPEAVILGDSGYTPMLEWLIPPLARHPNDPVENRFNRAHKRTRRLVENAFGVVKERFPCLNYLRVCPEYAAKIVIACCTLHNVACTVDRADDNILVMHDQLILAAVHEEVADDDEEVADDEGVVVEPPGGPVQQRLERLLFRFQ